VAAHRVGTDLEVFPRDVEGAVRRVLAPGVEGPRAGDVMAIEPESVGEGGTSDDETVDSECGTKSGNDGSVSSEADVMDASDGLTVEIDRGTSEEEAQPKVRCRRHCRLRECVR
jgi:hypothetical protein